MAFAADGRVVAVKIGILAAAIKRIKFLDRQDGDVFGRTSLAAFVAVLDYLIAFCLHHARETQGFAGEGAVGEGCLGLGV